MSNGFGHGPDQQHYVTEFSLCVPDAGGPFDQEGVASIGDTHSNLKGFFL